MELRVSIERRHIVYLVVSLLILTGINYTIAYGGNQPSIVGHNAEEIGEGTIAGILNITSDKVVVHGQVQIEGGSPDAGKVLTATNSEGNSSWQPDNECRQCRSCGGEWPVAHGRVRYNGAWGVPGYNCAGTWTDTGSPDLYICCKS
jgi:hypothetical protein